MQAPSGNVTFLFTDIERSSNLWETHPQAMGRALGQHDEMMREVFTENDGYIFKTMGDAFCVAFASALCAVRAAVAAQRRLAVASWEETGPLRIRIGLHSGEAEERDGDYFGQTLNRVARILSTGHGGQTLLSRVTAERVREELPPEITLRDLGERRLKDLSKPERIYQVMTGDLPAEFPPLRSLEVLPNNLPAQVTTFVGRGREMAELKRLIGLTRLLTLTGPGGTGKTRLSLQVAADVLERFAHGVWLVELATISDGAQIAEMVANVVDVREEAGRPPIDTLVAALRTRKLLLVIDNCEHVIGDVAKLAEVLLHRCPELTILASSREPLRIDGETIWSVPSLPAPNPEREELEEDFDTLAALEAVQLFVERAQAILPDFELTTANAPVVAQICWRLDGIPLAIELAAARVKMLPLPQILARLDDRFRLLNAGTRTAQRRQQTLGGLIDWSFDLLTEPERILLRRLTVFVAGRTLEMAEEVCSGDGLEREDVFDLLCALVDKSMVSIEPGPDGEPRYTMLESVWDYADQKLTQAGETATYRTRHLEFFVLFTETVEPSLMGADQQTWIERLNAEHHNVNFALEWALGSQERGVLGLRLAAALSRYWEIRSYLTEGRDHFRQLLVRADGGVPPRIRARAELGAGRLAWCQDHNEEAIQHYLEARRLFEQIGDQLHAGLITAMIGFAGRNLGHYEQSRECFQKAEAMARELGSDRLMATALSGLGSLAGDDGDLAAGRALKERALALFRSLGDRWIVSVVLWSVGKVCVAQPDHEAARKYLRESLSLSRQLGNKWSIPYVLEALADICAEENQPGKAIRLYAAASTQREALGLSFSVSEQSAHQTALGHLQSMVTPEEYAGEWAAGLALTTSASVALAMEEPATARPRPVRV